MATNYASTVLNHSTLLILADDLMAAAGRHPGTLDALERCFRDHQHTATLAMAIRVLRDFGHRAELPDAQKLRDQYEMSRATAYRWRGALSEWFGLQSDTRPEAQRICLANRRPLRKPTRSTTTALEHHA